MSTIPMESIQQQLEQDATLLEGLNLRMSFVSRRRLQDDLDAYKLTLPQYMVMRCLQDHLHGCSMSDLAASAHQLSATMTGIVDRLAERGLVERTRDPQDRRALLVMLTPAGRQLIEEINTAKHSLAVKVLSALSAEERQAMIETTQRYLEVLESTVRSS